MENILQRFSLIYFLFKPPWSCQCKILLCVILNGILTIKSKQQNIYAPSVDIAPRVTS